MKNSIALFVLLVFFSCKPVSDQEKEVISITQTINAEAELASIEETRQAFMKAVKENDVETIVRLSTPDIKTIAPGSDGWKEMYVVSKKEGPFPYDSIRMTPLETVIASDSVAYDFGNSLVYYTDAEGKVVELKDTFLAILKKGKDGVWRLHREVASSNVAD